MTDLDKEINDAGGWHEYHTARGDTIMADIYSRLYQRLKSQRRNAAINTITSPSTKKENAANYSDLRGQLLEAMNDIDELAVLFEDTFSDIFPNGWITVSKGSLGNDTVFFKFGAMDGAIPGGIAQNDPMYHMFSLTDIGGKYVLEKVHGSISVNPREKFMAMSSIKTPFRKTTGDGPKVAKAFKKFLTLTKDLFKHAESEIYNRTRYDDKFWE